MRTKVAHKKDEYVNTNVFDAIESTNVQRIIGGMLKENTGVHFLDSGDYYGRWWQRNQNRVFEREPKAWWIVDSENEFYPVLSTFWVLSTVLERDQVDIELERELYRIYKEEEDLGLLAGMEELAERINGYNYIIGNTYNDPDNVMLEQIIQYVIIPEYRGADRILLQIHGGCDVRGGYTYPRVFHIEYWGDLMSAISRVEAIDSTENQLTYDGYYYGELWIAKEEKLVTGKIRELIEKVGWKGDPERGKVIDRKGKEVELFWEW